MCQYPEEGFIIKQEVYKEVSMEEAFKFLLWCRVQLERRSWVIRRLSTDEILEKLIKSSNTAIRFVEESGYVERDPTASVKAMDLYAIYRKWCEEVNLIPMSRNDFYMVLDGMFMDYKREGVKWYKGVRIKWSVLQPEEKTLFD
jgi:phage/plasmid-associated DNA primase